MFQRHTKIRIAKIPNPAKERTGISLEPVSRLRVGALTDDLHIHF